MKTELTLEQSARLIQLGIDPKLASKCNMVMSMGIGVRGRTKYPDPKPIFTFTDIFPLLPRRIDGAYLCVFFNDGWYFCYERPDKHTGTIETVKSFVAPEPIDAFYLLLEWCLKNKSIDIKNRLIDIKNK